MPQNLTNQKLESKFKKISKGAYVTKISKVMKFQIGGLRKFFFSKGWNPITSPSPRVIGKIDVHNKFALFVLHLKL